ncbi:MAG: metallophosphoesterase [Pseudomonadota bacterium]
MLTRRDFLRLFGGAAAMATSLASYAFAVEPGFRLRVAHYRLTPRGWPQGFRARVAALSDVHASLPWMSADRIRRIVERTNGLEPDVTLLLGDYSHGSSWRSGDVHSWEWAPALGGLRARAGVFGVLGNHDWWSDRSALRRLDGPTYGQLALETAGVTMLENDAQRVEIDGRGLWLAGLGDQLAYLTSAHTPLSGRDDLDATIAAIGDAEEPVILMAHEPDIFPQVPDRVALTLSGHTHGGQVRLFGWAPATASRYGQRYVYGHVREDGRDLIVTGGLGYSVAPIRFGSPPEILLVDLG